MQFTSEFGKKNIYVRYGNYGTQAILTNNSIVSAPGGHTPINTQNNFNPSVAFKPMSNNKFMVAWVSEQAGVVGNPYSYVCVELDKSVAYGASGYRVSLPSYLRIPNNPSLSNSGGTFPIVSLSKHQDGLSRLYSCFAQESVGPLYSIVHKSHDWSSSSFFKTTGESVGIIDMQLSVGPNPFSNSLHISSANESLNLTLTDLQGRKIMAANGSVEELNKQLDKVAAGLSAGAYLLNVTEGVKNYQSFKVTKQ